VYPVKGSPFRLSEQKKKLILKRTLIKPNGGFLLLDILKCSMRALDIKINGPPVMHDEILISIDQFLWRICVNLVQIIIIIISSDKNNKTFERK